MADKDDETAPVLDPNVPLAQLWKSPVSELVTLTDSRQFPVEEQVRYRIHSLLVMALIAHYWNGNKRRSQARDEGRYPWRSGQLQPNGMYEGGDYLGHNICAIAVDKRGEVIDFDFNHNEVFNSSVEHAESRLVRRVFSLGQLYDHWDVKTVAETDANGYYTTTLSKVTVFTSLESCAQCAGMMALGTVKEVVYLQRDPGMYLIGNILRRLTTQDLRAPLPISGKEFGFGYYDELNAGFEGFYRKVGKEPFFEGIRRNGNPYIDKAPSITSFLCTDIAREIFNQARDEFAALKEAPHPTFVPEPGCLSNQELLDAAHRFFAYAQRAGRRGTPHQM